MRKTPTVWFRVSTDLEEELFDDGGGGLGSFKAMPRAFKLKWY